MGMVFRSGGQDDERKDAASGQGPGGPRVQDGSGDAGAEELVYYWAPRGDERLFDLLDWPQEARDLAESLMAASEIEHRWEAGKLVVDAADRVETQTVLDEVVAAFAPEGLDDDEADRVAYDLAGWPDHEIERLEEAIRGSGIAYTWTEEGELLVAEPDEAAVDAMFDELDLHGPEEGKVDLEGEELTALLTALLVCADRLAGDPDDGDAVIGFARAASEVEVVATPIGFDSRAWSELVARTSALHAVFVDAELDPDDGDVAAQARAIRDQLRAWL
jgi:hypothetical protein